MILNEDACKAGCGGGGGALEGDGIVWAVCPWLLVLDAESPRSDDAKVFVPLSSLF